MCNQNKKRDQLSKISNRIPFKIIKYDFSNRFFKILREYF